MVTVVVVFVVVMEVVVVVLVVVGDRQVNWTLGSHAGATQKSPRPGHCVLHVVTTKHGAWPSHLVVVNYLDQWECTKFVC